MQEYAILSVNECAKVTPILSPNYGISPEFSQVPSALPLANAATIPDNFVTAFFALFDQLKLPIPTQLPAVTAPPNADIPILIYGAGTSAGQYSIQLLKLAGYTRVIATASPKHHAFLRSFGAAHVFDYNSPTLIDEIKNAAGGKVQLALDCVSAASTLSIVSKVISPQGTLALLLPIKEGSTVAGTKLHAQIPEATNPFEKSLNIIYVSSLAYQAVSIHCLSLYSLHRSIFLCRMTISGRTCFKKSFLTY
jgi:NADPH:quinone reductase-like Zn-dependent oxidoreductase